MVLYIVLGVTFAIIVICRCVWLNNGNSPKLPRPPMHNHVYGRLLNSYGGGGGGGGGGGIRSATRAHLHLVSLSLQSPFNSILDLPLASHIFIIIVPPPPPPPPPPPRQILDPGLLENQYKCLHTIHTTHTHGQCSHTCTCMFLTKHCSMASNTKQDAMVIDGMKAGTHHSHTQWQRCWCMCLK